MPVTWKLQRILDAHGITPYRLMKESGLSQGTVYRLVNGVTSSVNTNTLNRVMAALRRLTDAPVEIADLLEFEEDPEEAPRRALSDRSGQ